MSTIETMPVDRIPTMQRRSLLAGMVAMGSAMAGAAALPGRLAAAPLDKVKALGTLRVAVYRDNRPWSWNDAAADGPVRGIDADLGRALAAKLGVKAEVVAFMPGDDVSADLRNVVWRGGLLGFQPCDVMLHVPFDHALEMHNDNVAILAPYYREGFAMVCGNGVDDCEVPPPDFKGKRLAVETGSVSDGYLVGGFGGALRNDVRHFPDGYMAAAAVGAGKADAALATRAQVEAMMHDMPAAAMHRRKGFLPAMTSPGWDVAMAVKDNSRSLGDALETIVAGMCASGEMAALFAPYGVEWHAALAAA